MRFLIQATIPAGIVNKMVEDADSLEKAEKCIKAFNPEAVYFTEINGDAALVSVLEIPSAEMIDVVFHQLQHELGAIVQIRPVLVLDDLKKATEIRKQQKLKNVVS